MALDIGRIAYEKYNESLNRDYNCESESWEEIPKRGQDAWREAAVAVLHYVNNASTDEIGQYLKFETNARVDYISKLQI